MKYIQYCKLKINQGRQQQLKAMIFFSEGILVCKFCTSRIFFFIIIIMKQRHKLVPQLPGQNTGK